MEGRMSEAFWYGIAVGFVATNVLHVVVGLCIVAARSDRKLETRLPTDDDPDVIPLHEHAERPYRPHHTHHRGA